MDLIVTSGGLGPTADDLTAEVVAEFAGREMRARRGAGGPDRGDPRAAARALARRDRRGRDARRQPQAGDGARGRDGARAGRAPRPGWWCPADGATVVVLPGPPGELQPMWRAALETEALQAALAGAGRLRAADHAPVRAARVRDRQDAARRRGATACRSTAWRSRPACAAARSRSRRSSSPTPRRTTPPSRPPCASATARRCSRATARRSTSWWPRRCSGRRCARSRSRSRARAG